MSDDAARALVRPIIGIKNRTAQEAFDIMADRIAIFLANRPAPNAAQPQSREERGNLQTVLAYEAGQRNANAAMCAHFAKMQDMARRYLEPGAYVDREGARYAGCDVEGAFIADMIHMLDGPEQRAAFPNDAAPADPNAEWVMVRNARDEAVRSLQVIRGHTDPDTETSYRADDREGCLDAVHAESSRALAYIDALNAAPAPQPLDPATVEACAKVADEWAAENRAACARARRGPDQGGMADMLDGASIECNAIAQTIRALTDHPVARAAVLGEGAIDGRVECWSGWEDKP